MNTVTLDTPVPLGDDVITTMTFKAPTGRQLRTLKMPIVGSGVDAAIHEERMAKWIADLAGVPDRVVDEMTVPDWMRCATVVAGFFGAASATKS